MEQPVRHSPSINNVFLAPDRSPGLFPLTSRLCDLEAMWGSVIGFLIATVVLFGGAIWAVGAFVDEKPPDISTAQKILRVILWLLGTLLAFKSVHEYHRAMTSVPCPRPALVAANQSRWPLLLRPLQFAWWAAHALLIGAFAQRIIGSSSTQYYSPSELRMNYAVNFVIYFMASNAMYAYILMAIGVIHSRQSLLAMLWRFRIGFDIAICLTLSQRSLLHR